jgi:hypothetical protein
MDDIFFRIRKVGELEPCHLARREAQIRRMPNAVLGLGIVTPAPRTARTRAGECKDGARCEIVVRDVHWVHAVIWKLYKTERLDGDDGAGGPGTRLALVVPAPAPDPGVAAGARGVRDLIGRPKERAR